MEFKVEAAIPRAAHEVWAVLVDIPKIAGCIPGCEDVVERDRLVDYSAVLKQKLGPFKVALPATIAVQEVREPNWIQALASGTEKFTGTRIDVTLRLDLRDTEPGNSLMVAECDMQVAGKLASLGYSIIKKKAEENFAEFRSRLLKVLQDCPVLQAHDIVVEGSANALPQDPVTMQQSGLDIAMEPNRQSIESIEFIESIEPISGNLMSPVESLEELHERQQEPRIDVPVARTPAEVEANAPSEPQGVIEAIASTVEALETGTESLLRSSDSNASTSPDAAPSTVMATVSDVTDSPQSAPANLVQPSEDLRAPSASGSSDMVSSDTRRTITQD